MSEPTEGLPPIEELDRDGALRETADAVRGDTRASFFMKSGALVAGGMALGALPIGLAIAQGGTPKSDVKILNFALTLEYLESAFYAEAVSKGGLDGEVATFAQVVSRHEAAHVAALQKALGSAAAKKPEFDFKGTTASKKDFVKTTITLEDTGVAAYEGQATEIKTPAVLMAAGSILPVEARHAAWIRDINGRGEGSTPAPDAFNPSMTMDEVLSAVKSTGFIKG